LRFRGVTAITPNESEAEKATRIRLVNDQSVSRAANLLKERLGLKAVLITRGNRGMTLLEKSGKISHIPIVGPDDITDVTGAGDTVATIFTLSLASGANFFDAASLANYAASIVVMKSGTAVITKDELLEAVKKDHEGSKNSS
jgi:rfaE bifunctional protein kinase chain/domain